jgi:hypothetical protein
MDMIKLHYRWSSGTTPDLEPDKLAQGVSSATNAMTQMTARTVSSEAQPATRPPLQPLAGVGGARDRDLVDAAGQPGHDLATRAG